MKKINFIFCLILVICNSFAQEDRILIINFEGMESDNGALYVGVHNNQNDFLKKNFREKVFSFKGDKAQVIFNDLPNGNYAISSFHDANNNNKLDTNFIGIPKEPIGVSNDAKGFMGPPKYEDAKFYFNGKKEITIQIN